MVVETLLPTGIILDIWDTSYSNYFAADKNKSLTCRVFIEAEMILLCVYVEFHITLLKSFQIIFTRFFDTILFL